MQSALRYVATLTAALSATAALTACGGGGGSSPSQPVSVAFSTSPPSSLTVGATASIAALVSNDSTNSGVTWTAACASAACGSLSASSSPSGSAVVYTAPAALPNPATVTITATAVAGGAQVSSAVTIAPAAGPLLADGTYVFHLSGQDGVGPYSVSGAFSVAGGKITGGEQDFTDPNAGFTNILSASTSSLNVAGGNLQIVLDTGNPAIGVNGIETLRATVVSPTRLLLSEFDLSAAGTGSLDLQTSKAAPQSGYAFAVSGTDTSGNPLAIGGILDVVGNQVVVGASVFDFSAFNPNTNSSYFLRGQSFQSGSVTPADPYGRVVFTLTPSTASGISSFALAGYVVGADRIQLVESAQDGDLLNANTGGMALGQGRNTGLFNANSSSVLGQSYAHGSSGMDPNGPTAMSGAFALNTGGVLGGVLAVNDLSNVGAWNIGGTYSVDPTGRVTLSIGSLTSQTAEPPADTMTFELYLDGNGKALVMGADAFQTTQGLAFEQAGSSNLAGGFALAAQGAIATTSGGLAWSAVGPVAVSTGNFSGTTDYSLVTAAPQGAVVLGGFQDPNRGLLHLTGLNATDFGASTGYGYYPLSGNRLWAIEVDRQGVSLLLMEGVSP